MIFFLCSFLSLSFEKCISMSQTKQWNVISMVGYVCHIVTNLIITRNEKKKKKIPIHNNSSDHYQFVFFFFFFPLSVCLSFCLVLIRLYRFFLSFFFLLSSSSFLFVCLVKVEKRRLMKRNIFCHTDNHLLFSIATYSKLNTPKEAAAAAKKPNRSNSFERNFTLMRSLSRSLVPFCPFRTCMYKYRSFVTLLLAAFWGLVCA